MKLIQKEGEKSLIFRKIKQREKEKNHEPYNKNAQNCDKR